MFCEQCNFANADQRKKCSPEFHVHVHDLLSVYRYSVMVKISKIGSNRGCTAQIGGEIIEIADIETPGISEYELCIRNNLKSSFLITSMHFDNALVFDIIYPYIQRMCKKIPSTGKRTAAAAGKYDVSTGKNDCNTNDKFEEIHYQPDKQDISTVPCEAGLSWRFSRTP